jgi:hypothetical protein
MGEEWRFHGYVTPSGVPDVQRWIDDLEGGARDELEDVVAYLRISHVGDWKRPYFGPMRGGLHEIRFNHANVEYRIFGTFGPEQQQFSMLVGATKTHGKGRGKTKYAPKNAIKTARSRKRELDLHAATTTEIVI